MWLTDPKSGEKSVTLTAFISGFAVATLKLLLSGVTIAGIALAPFSGSDYAMVVGAVGALYWARKNTKSQNKD
jgi:hypothetical protein